jgi:hypothetical protein
MTTKINVLYFVAVAAVAVAVVDDDAVVVLLKSFFIKKNLSRRQNGSHDSRQHKSMSPIVVIVVVSFEETKFCTECIRYLDSALSKTVVPVQIFKNTFDSEQLGSIR